jgi:hypothetical protein
MHARDNLITGVKEPRYSWAARSILAAAVLFNALLAIVNAHVSPISEQHVMLTQALILLAGALLIAFNRKRLRTLFLPVAFLCISLFLFLWVYVFNGWFFVKSFGDMVIIGIFLLLGELTDEKQLIKTFRFLCLIIVPFMIMEAFLTDTYVKIFEPAQYYANTRGIGQSMFNNTGLFSNALGFEGRFSFGLHIHRLASIFLEQVSLGGIAMVLAMLLSTFWERLKRSDRLLFTMTIVFILVGTDSRTGSILCVCILLGHSIFPRLPKWSPSAVMPLILFISAILFYDPSLGKHASDDIQGRVGATMSWLASLSAADIFVGNLNNASMTADTGYTYVICTQTVMGLILLWLFSSQVVPRVPPENKRFVFGLNIYTSVCLLTGAAVFSIKTNAPLWFIAGCLCQRNGDDRAG